MKIIQVKRTTIFFIFLQTVSPHEWTGWPASNYSKAAAKYGEGALDDMVDWSQHPCKRECKDNDLPMTCHYGFTVEKYTIMSKACYDCPFNVTDCYRPHCVPGDGNMRIIRVVNRRLPGPIIEVCKGDRIIVDLKNMLRGESTTIHWHGLHQIGTPFMDGVPMVSQCPIPAEDSFRYDFVADIAGTHWWHSHSEMQRGDGLFGGLIVRSSPSENHVGHLYDRDEHIIMMNEWNDQTTEDVDLLLRHAKPSLINIRSVFVNGLGRDWDNTNSSLIPQPVFHVEKGRRHRFRLIQTDSFQCYLSISVDQHSLLVISADGADVEPIEVDTIRMIPAGRYDFVLNANRNVGNYWIHIRASGYNCESKYQDVILRYEGAVDADPVEPTGSSINVDPSKRILNPAHQGIETEGAMCVPCSLTSIEHDNRILAPTPDYQLYINLDLYLLTNPIYLRENLYDVDQIQIPSFTAQMNHLSFQTLKFPLQTQTELIRPDQLCNVAEAKCTRNKCSCPHVIELKLNSTVEIIFVSSATHRDVSNHLADDELAHAIHMHGFYYRVLAMEKLGRTTSVEEVKFKDQAGRIHRKLENAPWKDVVEVPSGGYVIIRFRADNPGYWFLHCHLESHMHGGMAVALKVGENEDFPLVPQDIPKFHYHI